MTEQDAEYYKPCSTCHNDKCVWMGSKDTHLICKDYKSMDGNCISRAYIESIVEELENICINGDEHILSLLSNIKNAPSVTPTIPDVENNFNIGYNCGYADAMSDVAEGSDSE